MFELGKTMSDGLAGFELFPQPANNENTGINTMHAGIITRVSNRGTSFVFKRMIPVLLPPKGGAVP
jgi:hypothetical protein